MFIVVLWVPRDLNRFFMARYAMQPYRHPHSLCPFMCLRSALSTERNLSPSLLLCNCISLCSCSRIISAQLGNTLATSGSRLGASSPFDVPCQALTILVVFRCIQSNPAFHLIWLCHHLQFFDKLLTVALVWPLFCHLWCLTGGNEYLLKFFPFLTK